jgi:cell division protein FtsI/penicillin-binding protein 2
MLAAIAALSAQSVYPQNFTLFSQTASAVLDRQFGRMQLSWLLVDDSGRILAQNWKDPQTPIAPGSLVKPFVALAYGEQHRFQYPHEHCSGTRDRCWLPRGHGWLGMEEAMAQSCNAYFLSLARGLNRDRANEVFVRFGLLGPPLQAPDAAFIGLGDAWKETPLSLARAYFALVNQETDGRQDRILRGLESAAQVGTARRVDEILGSRAALAKTGTGVCSHHPRAAADGFAIVLYPDPQPRLLLLVRMHGGTGAQAAAVAGAMLRSIGEGVQ